MLTSLTSTGGVVQSPNFPGDYGNNSRACVVTIVVPVGWMIQLKFTTFNLETGKASVQVRKRNRISASDTAVKLVCFLLPYTTFNTIPALVPATINTMNIGFQSFNSSKPSTAIYNWQATFSVTVNFILHQRSFYDIFIVSDFSFSGLDRAKGTPIHSMD
jgi:hypothetical protein